jgi:phosphatidylserine/phosphatidylglycerophosphate/cardiolipin synthase-like enzyme
MSSSCGSGAADLALRTNTLTIGGTSLIDQLIGFCSLYPDGELFLTAPFFDEHVIQRILTNTSSAVALRIVVRTKDAARRMRTLLEERRRKCVIYVNAHLHAKLYVFECKNRVIAALIGSHNPTRAGSKTNIEIGVFLSATPGRPEWQPIQQAREYILSSARFQDELPIGWR